MMRLSVKELSWNVENWEDLKVEGKRGRSQEDKRLYQKGTSLVCLWWEYTISQVEREFKTSHEGY